MTDRKIVQCVSPFATSVGGAHTVVSAGDLYFADDDVVQGREALFADVKVKSSSNLRGHRTAVSSSALETADAAPGKRRRMSKAPEDNKAPEVPEPVNSEV